MRFKLPLLLYAAVTLMSFSAIAQPSSAHKNPADADTRVPEVKYGSTFSGYAPYREEKVAPWRDVNDEVGRVGGHMGIFRGAKGGQSATPPSTPGAAAGRGHSPGHKR